MVKVRMAPVKAKLMPVRSSPGKGLALDKYSAKLTQGNKAATTRATA
jgi:hypothetical protein